jgi:hypothetical protein
MRSVGRDHPLRLDEPADQQRIIPIAFSSDRVSSMPIFTYFLYVGSLLSALLFAWCVYLEPPTNKAQATPPPARLPEVFRPTPAPPIDPDVQQLHVGESPEPAMANAISNGSAKIARAKQKKRTQVVRRPATPDRSVAYFPQRSFFFDWRY